MSVAIRTAVRIQDQDDAPSLGAGQDGYALTWDNASGAFVATALFSGGLLATGATTGATSQAQAFTNGIIIPNTLNSMSRLATFSTADTNETDFVIVLDDQAIFNSVRNNTLAIGYNVGPVDASKAVVALTWESHFQYGASDSMSEWYLNMQSPAIGSSACRPIMATVNHQNDFVLVAYSANQVHWYGRGSDPASMMFQPATGEFILTSVLLKSNSNDTWAMEQINAAGNGYVPLIKANAQNRVEIGASGYPVYTSGGMIFSSSQPFLSAAGIYGTLSDVAYLTYAGYETTYRHKIQASIADGGTSNAGLNRVNFALSDGSATTTRDVLRLRGDWRVFQGAASSAPDDADMGANRITFYFDEVNNKLKVRVKYSDNTLKTGEVALT